MKHLNPFLFLVPLTVAGCAGSGTTSSSDSGSGSTTSATFGSVTTNTLGAFAAPVYIGSRSAVFTGVYGAGFSSVTIKYPAVESLTEAEALSLSDIVMDCNGAPIIYSYATGVMKAPVGRQFYSTSSTPSLSGLGNRFAYVRDDGHYSRIHSVNVDGTDDRIVSAAGISASSPAYSPDGNSIVYSQYEAASGKYRLYKVGALGGTPTAITSTTDNDIAPAWSPDGSQILFFCQTNATGLYYPCSITPTGTNQTDLYGQGVSYPSGVARIRNSTLYLESGYAPSSYRLWQIDPADGSTMLSEATDPIGSVSTSPVASKFVLSRGGTSGGVFVRDSATGVETQIAAAAYNSPSWGGIPTSRVAVGTGGALTTAAVGGFMFGQTGSGLVKSFVSFDAATRSTLAIDKQTDANPTQSVAVCTLYADSIKSLIYSNDLKGSPNVVATAAAPIRGAVISFSSDSGHVISVVPFVQSAAVKADQAGFRFTGRFLAPYQAGAKTRSASGGTTLTLDPATGKVQSLR